jgi:CspA family cold shock protein
LPGFCFKKEGKDLKGKVKKLIRDRGFGFITAEDDQEVFFHRSDLVEADFDTMEEGANVEFDLESGAKGPRATKVKVTD